VEILGRLRLAVSATAGKDAFNGALEIAQLAVWTMQQFMPIDAQDHIGYSSGHKSTGVTVMRFASGAEVKNRLSTYLAQARRTKEPVIVTHYGKPYALIQPVSERGLEDLGWKQLSEARLREVWEGEDDGLYDYL
jgi:prevent-host-death family protein